MRTLYILFLFPLLAGCSILQETDDEEAFIQSADSLFPASKLIRTHRSPHNLTTLVFRTNQEPDVSERRFVEKLEGKWKRVNDEEFANAVANGMCSQGLNVLASFLFKNLENAVSSIFSVYIDKNEGDGYRYTVIINVSHCPKEFKSKKENETKPNNALQPTPVAVTPRAFARVAPSTCVADL